MELVPFHHFKTLFSFLSDILVLKIIIFSIVNMHEVESVEWDQMRVMLSCLGSRCLARLGLGGRARGTGACRV